jgi:hypothetical protein
MSGRWSKRIFLKERKFMSKLDPRQTLITLPNEIPWQVPDVAPPDSVAEAVLVGAEEQEGTYLVLMKGSRLDERAAHLCDGSLVRSRLRGVVV